LLRNPPGLPQCELRTARSYYQHELISINQSCLI
jgi:hypothetical protein